MFTHIPKHLSKPLQFQIPRNNPRHESSIDHYNIIAYKRIQYYSCSVNKYHARSCQKDAARSSFINGCYRIAIYAYMYSSKLSSMISNSFNS